MRNNKKAAMEMSVGTIVTIVLLVSVLILGLFLVQKIFGSATKVIDLTDAAMINQINKLFAEPQKVAIYPATREAIIKQEDTDEVGIVIKNLIQGGTGQEKFSYAVTLSDKGNCRETPEQISSWIIIGSKEDNFAIPSGDAMVKRVRFNIPTGTSLCTARFAVAVSVDGKAYGGDNFDIEIAAK
jgi:hypothetical protein